MMRGTALTRVNQNKITDLHLRLDVLEQRGQYFRNPVSAFIVTNGPAMLGVKVQFQVYLTKGVDSVEILRNTARDYSTAAVLQTYALSELTVNKPIVYYDNDKTIINLKAYYWIRVIPKPGKFQPLVQGPQIVTVPPNMDTSLNAPNEASNTTNFATVDSVDAGASATIRIYGTGGVGTSWTKATGYGATLTFSSGQIAGQAYSTKFYVYWTGSSYSAFAAIPSTVPDNYQFAGTVTTVAHGGGGGSNGGGGAGGGAGGQRIVNF